MAGKSAAAVEAVDRPERVRNVALVGHSGAGKTTLVEALLAATGVIPRPGTVVDGTTVTDSDPVEHHQQRSVSLAVAPLEHDRVKVNLLDTPGYADFTGELRAGLRAADAALFVVSAVDGVDALTVSLWEECAAVSLPRAVVVTRLDHQRASYEEAVAGCQRAFGAGVLPLYLPDAPPPCRWRCCPGGRWTTLGPGQPTACTRWRGRRRRPRRRRWPSPGTRSSRGSSPSPRTRR